MDRHTNHRDQNEPAIRATYHKVGVKTYLLQGGPGMADLLCVATGRIFLVEVKTSSKGRLSPDQVIFRDEMHHSQVGYYMVWDADSALDALAIEQVK